MSSVVESNDLSFMFSRLNLVSGLLSSLSGVPESLVLFDVHEYSMCPSSFSSPESTMPKLSIVCEHSFKRRLSTPLCHNVILLRQLACSWPCVVLARLINIAVLTASAENYLHLRFFQHERILGTPNATVVLSVNADNSGLATGFGNIVAYDNALRETTDLRAPIIGHSQGLGIGSDRSGASGFTVFSMVFTGGKYNGSSLDIQGIFISQPLLETVSERAIVGGTGRFRGARGYLLSKEIVLTPETLTGQLDAYIKF
ncbi:hypothetical protein ZIOFF_008865 [Zingiber officinale]|uniref:Dirigent protein n=1 Tax=Zingiber officinale TaxID=94328 RepID=A0A8J5I7B0_ZINOF|nr:hypothetical protein ZIOFF_008865 [Zingiber officinale]